MKAILLFAGIIFLSGVTAQVKHSKQYKINSDHTSFPDTGRMAGHRYHDVLYDAQNHYSNHSVLIVVPPTFKAGKNINFIFWFHGWNNNIDTALVYYHLLTQFEESKVNAVLVLSETASNAPDSYGGKLEQQGMFSELVNDVLVKLKQEKQISNKSKPGKILLAGHSGAYRVMANILHLGGMPVNEVILFDALYANTNEYINWIKQDDAHRFINLYTSVGGTDEETKRMINELTLQNVSIKSIEETENSVDILRNSRILFIHSAHEHNDIIFNPDNFKMFLEQSVLMK